MALVKWYDDEEENQKEDLFSPRQIASVQSSWQPTMANNTQSQKPQSYLMSDEKAQADQQLAQRRAAEAQAAAQAAAARQYAQAQQRQAQQQQQQQQQAAPTVKNPEQAKNDTGWKQFYNEEFDKAKKGQNFFQRLLDGGQASRMAELNARNRYTSSLLRKAYDDNGNILDANAAQSASALAQYNSGVAANNAARTRAISNAIGATHDNRDRNVFDRVKSTGNAIRNMNLYDGVAGVNDETKFSLDDVGRFGGSLVQGIATAPILAGKSLTEAVRGRGTKADTGLEGELTGAERAGRTISGLLDAVTPFMAGSGQLVQSLATKVMANAATAAERRLLSRMLAAAAEEGVLSGSQAGAEYFGQGGVLVDENGEIDVDKLAEFGGQVGMGAGMGAVGGAALSGAATGINRLGKGKRLIPEPDTAPAYNGVAPQPDSASGNRVITLPQQTPITDTYVPPRRHTQPVGPTIPERPVTPEPQQMTPEPQTPKTPEQAAVDEVRQRQSAQKEQIAEQPIEQTQVRDESVQPTPAVADGVVNPQPVIPEADPNMPVIKGEQVRQLQEARVGKTQAEEAEINQRLQELAADTPSVYRSEAPDRYGIGQAELGNGLYTGSREVAGRRADGTISEEGLYEYKVNPEAKVLDSSSDEFRSLDSQASTHPSLKEPGISDTEWRNRKTALLGQLVREAGYDGVKRGTNQFVGMSERALIPVTEGAPTYRSEPTVPDNSLAANKSESSFAPDESGIGEETLTWENPMRTVRNDGAEAYRQNSIENYEKYIASMERAGKSARHIKGLRQNLEALKAAKPGEVYRVDPATGKTELHPASELLQSFSKYIGEDTPPIVIGNTMDRPGANNRIPVNWGNANATYAAKLSRLDYKNKNSVYHETMHHIDHFIRGYEGKNPKMLELRKLRDDIPVEEMRAFKAGDGRAKNKAEYVAHVMDSLLDGRIKAGELGKATMRYIKKFFSSVKEALSSGHVYGLSHEGVKIADYVKKLDAVIHDGKAPNQKPLSKKELTPTTKNLPPAMQPKSKGKVTPVKPKPADPEKQARKDFANVFTRSTDSNSDMDTRLRNATGMTKEAGSDVAQILEDGGITGEQAERITKLFDRAAELAESNKKIQKQYRKDFIKGGKDAINDTSARQRNRETEEAAYIRSQLNAELKKLERKGDVGEKLAQGFENVISGKNVNQLIGAPIERGFTAEVIGNAMNTIKNPIKQIRGATMHGMPGRSAVKRLIRELKTPPKTVTEGYKYLLGNSYRALMTPAQALADSRKGAFRTELTRYAYKQKIGELLPNAEAEKVSRMAGNDMEALVNMGAGVDNGTISIFAYRKALKQWKKFIESGSEADYSKFMDTIDRQTSIVDRMAQGFKTEGKNRAARAGLTLVNALLPYMRNAVNMSTKGVVLDLNPFTLSLIDGIRKDQRGFMSNLALGIKNKTVDYAVLAALGSVLTYNDGTDPDTADQPRGVSIHLGGDEYFAIRGTPLELPLGALMVAKQLAQDGVKGDFRDAGYYGGMITPSIPYVDYMTSHGNVIDSLEKMGTEEGDGGYAAKNFLVGNVKSLVPYSNNNIEASLSRFGEGESLTAKSVYASKEVPDGKGGTKRVADIPKWIGNSIRQAYDPAFRATLPDSRDAAGRVRTVDNQGSWMRKKINDKNTATYNDTINDLVKYARQNKLGKGTQDMFNTYPDGKNNNFKSVQDKITFLDAPEKNGKKTPDNAKKLEPNEKLYDLNQQIYNGFFGDGADELLTLNGEELRSDVAVPGKNNPGKNTNLPISIASIRNAIAQTDLPQEDWDKLNSISEAKSAIAERAKSGEISWSQYYNALPDFSAQESAILANSPGNQRLNGLMTKLRDTGFFEQNGFGSTRSGQTYLWNSLNAMLGDSGKTPAAEWAKNGGSGFTPWGRGGRGGSGGRKGLNNILTPAEMGTKGVRWSPVGKRQMASVKTKGYTPFKTTVKLDNAVKKNRTQNYADRSF